MRWPFVLRAVHESEMAAKDRELASAHEQESYWRARAELYIDRAGARAGISHEPIMRNAGEVPIVSPHDANPFSGFGMSVIDSSRSDSKAASS